MSEKLNEPSQEAMQENLVRDVLKRELGVESKATTVLTGGQVGNVYRVETSDAPYVVKFVDFDTEPSYEEEPVDNRVYGARQSNLKPAYNLLRESGIAVPELYATGVLEKEKLHYEIMEYLQGDPDDYSPEWFAGTGKALGEMHKVKRPFQGWMGMDKPHSQPWNSAFAESFGSQLDQVKPFLDQDLYDSVSRFVSTSNTLTDPSEFVLSHTDGFQGVMKKNHEQWELRGVVDIEDFQFTDQRFALAGFELQHSLKGRTVPDEFWDEYKNSVDVDKTYDTYKALFQIYYLLVWVRVLRDQPAPLEEVRAQLAGIVKDKEAK